MVFYYFVSTNKLESEILKECGVRNSLISYAYMDRFGYNLSKVRQDFDMLFMDSGAFTAMHTGKKIDRDKYYEEVKKQKDVVDVVAQFDVIGDTEETIKNYKVGQALGIDWMLPIAQGSWVQGIYQFEQLLGKDNCEYFGLGFEKAKLKGLDIIRFAKNLPRYKYHGFAKAYTELIENKLLWSTDSSSWSFGARARSSPYMTPTGKGGLFFGKIGKDNRIDAHRVCMQNKDDCEACGLNVDDLLEGIDIALYKSAIALYYRPWFRKIGDGMFEKNFKW